MTLAREITAQLVTIGPGEEFYQLHGHALLRIITADTDSIYSFETVADRPAIAQFLAGNRGSIVAAPSPGVLDSLSTTGRSVRLYSLNLTPAQSSRLDSLLRNASGHTLDRFNMRSANCTTVIFDLMNQATAPAKVTPGHSSLYSGSAAHFYTDTLQTVAPWVTTLITLTLGTHADARVTDARSISPLLFDAEYGSFLIEDRASKRPLVTGYEELAPQLYHPSPPAVTPEMVAIVIDLLLVVTSIFSLLNVSSKAVAIMDNISFGIIFLAGGLIAFATFTPYRMGGAWSWSLTVLNPLIILVPTLSRNHPTAYRVVAAIWASWLVVFAIFGSAITAQALPCLRLLAPAIALRILTVPYQ